MIEHIADRVFSQGPRLRFFGIRRPDVQTGRTGQHITEACLYGLTDPRHVRNLLLGRTGEWS